MRNEQMNKRRVMVVAGLVVLALIATMTGAGCRKKSTPEKTVAQFFEYLYAGDSGSARTLCTSSALEQEENGQRVFNRIRDEHSRGDNVYTENKLVVDIRGNTAEVYSRDDESLRLLLVKEGDRWLIDEFRLQTRDRNRGEDARNRDRDNEEDREGDEEEEQEEREERGTGRDRDNQRTRDR